MNMFGEKAKVVSKNDRFKTIAEFEIFQGTILNSVAILAADKLSTCQSQKGKGGGATFKSARKQI